MQVFLAGCIVHFEFRPEEFFGQARFASIEAGIGVGFVGFGDDAFASPNPASRFGVQITFGVLMLLPCPESKIGHRRANSRPCSRNSIYTRHARLISLG